MSVTVVVGAQFGGEGKGKICAHLALADDVHFMVRCGGPNSGHTVDLNGTRYELKQVPAGFVNPNTRLLMAAGSFVKPALLLEEISLAGLTPERFGIDRNAFVIEQADVDSERALDLRDRLGSTAVGMGAAVSRRVLRAENAKFACDVPELQPYVTDVQSELSAALRKQAHILVEGTQGYGLSLYHAEVWPFRTSRDTTAHSFLGEVGLGTRNFNVVLAVRTYPIRVGGRSGPLPQEISWEELRALSGYPHSISEYTTTTKRLRRVARFDWAVVDAAITANCPTHIAVHGVDYLDYSNKGVTEFDALTLGARAFVSELEDRSGARVAFIGTGPDLVELVDRRRTVTSLLAAS